MSFVGLLPHVAVVYSPGSNSSYGSRVGQFLSVVVAAYPCRIGASGGTVIRKTTGKEVERSHRGVGILDGNIVEGNVIFWEGVFYEVLTVETAYRAQTPHHKEFSLRSDPSYVHFTIVG